MTESPPWRADAWDLELDLTKIDQQWPLIRMLLQDDELATARAPDVSQWSPGEHASHVLLVAGIIADAIEGNLSEPGRHRDEQPHELAHRVLDAGVFRRGVASSPSAALPHGRSREDFLCMLPDVVRAWDRIRDRAPELSQCAARAEHFTLGYLSSSEWVRMCAIHTAHHLALVRDIVGDEALGPAGSWSEA